MSETRVTQTRIKRTVIDGDMDLDSDVRVSKSRTYQVYRGMSPSTSNRLEIRLRELEDALDAERDGRMRAEKEVTEMSFQLESLSERLDEADGLTSAQSEVSRKRESDLMKMRKDMELISVQFESNEVSLRKRHQEQVNDMTDQIEYLTKGKGKAEKERQTLILEIDGMSTSLDSANKAAQHASAKAEALEDQLRRLKAQIDDLTRQNHDLNSFKARLSAENGELQRSLHELDSSNANLSKTKAQLQHQLDEAKNRLDDEVRQKNQLSVTVNNITIEIDQLTASYEDEVEANNQNKAQVSRLNGELSALRTKYEKELLARLEEIEDIKRRTNARIAELSDIAEQMKAKAGKLEKDKNRLTIEIREITIELDTAQAQVQDLSKQLKHAQQVNHELSNRNGELERDNQNLNSQNTVLAGENARLKALCNDLQDKVDNLSRENKQLSDALREAVSQNKDLSRQVQELTSIRINLEAERDNLAAELADNRDALRDALAKLESANNALSSLRLEMENRMREKDEEIDNIRKAGQRALDELQRTIIEIESRYKSEISRLKKKYEVEIREYEIQIETLNRSNGELAKSNKSMSARLKEIEIALDEERRSGEEARQAVTVLERKRIALTTELEDVRSLLETAERSRKNAEGELYEAGARINELTISITTISNEKRRLEADIGGMQADLDEAVNARRASDERADRLANENSRLSEELRQEQENYKNAEALRKQLEIEIREITVRLEEAEAFAQREGKRMVAKLNARLRDLEAELDMEQRKSREFSVANRKLDRSLNELRVSSEDDRRMCNELSEQCNTLTIRVKTLRRQLEEAEEVVTITMNKYRKSQSMLEEADHRADIAEKSVTLRTGRNRSMSVTREVVRVMRV